MIHRIGEMDLIPEGISVEETTPGRPSDYCAVHCRVGAARVRLRAYRPGPGWPIQWDVEHLERDQVTTPAAGVLTPTPRNYFTDDPAPIWETP
jgi:hypothetical protein